MPYKPHVLLLIDDEHRPDVIAIEGNPHCGVDYRN